MSSVLNYIKKNSFLKHNLDQVLYPTNFHHTMSNKKGNGLHLQSHLHHVTNKAFCLQGNQDTCLFIANGNISERI